MPDNPMTGKAGNTTRLNQMLSYFDKNENLSVHFVSLADWGDWKKEDLLAFRLKFPNLELRLLNKKHKKEYLKYFFLYKIPYLVKRNSIDISSYILRRDFTKIINSKKFDIVIISYALWGKLIEKIPYDTYKILDTHDFITGQCKNRKSEVGKLFGDEIDILKNFDEIWTYSIEEQYIFEQFTDKKVTLIPVSFPINFNNQSTEKKYDAIYVASNNPHNISGINWFVNEVMPFLNNVNIHVVGKIGEYIADHKNIIKHGIVDDLTDFYLNSKIAICPMLSGTGIKIKVVEALSHGVPVITNQRGVDGLLNKRDNGCIVTDDPEIFAEQMMRLLHDKIYYSEIKQKAHHYYIENHDPKLELNILNKIFNK